MNKFLGVYGMLVDDQGTDKRISARVHFKGGGTKPPDQTQQIAAERASLENTNRLLTLYEQTFAPYEKELLYQSMGVVNPERVEEYSKAIDDSITQETALKAQMEAAKAVIMRRTNAKEEDFLDFTKIDGQNPDSYEKTIRDFNSDEKNYLSPEKNISPEYNTFKMAKNLLGSRKDKKREKRIKAEVASAVATYKAALAQLPQVVESRTAAITDRKTEIETQRKNTVAAQTGIALKQGDEIAKTSIAQTEGIQQRQTDRYGIAGSAVSDPLKDTKTLAETTAKVGSTNLALEGNTANREGMRLAALGLGAPHSGAAQTLQNQGLAYNQASQNWSNFAAQQGQQASLAYGNMWNNIGKVVGTGLGVAYNYKNPPKEGDITANLTAISQLSGYNP